MSRQFSIPTVLRSVPNVMLRECFERLGHADPELKWEQLRENEATPIRVSLEALPSAKFNIIESTLRSVYDLGCESGFAALREAACRCGVPNLGSLAPEDTTFYGKAMWAWLNYQEGTRMSASRAGICTWRWKREKLGRCLLDQPQCPSHQRATRTRCSAPLVNTSSR